MFPIYSMFFLYEKVHTVVSCMACNICSVIVEGLKKITIVPDCNKFHIPKDSAGTIHIKDKAEWH